MPRILMIYRPEEGAVLHGALSVKVHEIALKEEFKLIFYFFLLHLGHFMHDQITK